MSRAGKKRSLEIPAKPESVQALERQMREQRMMNLYGQCRFKIRGRFLPFPELHGALIADNVLAQVMQQMIMAQSQVVVPKPQVVLSK